MAGSTEQPMRADQLPFEQQLFLFALRADCFILTIPKKRPETNIETIIYTGKV
jgi:hypothetical protein